MTSQFIYAEDLADLLGMKKTSIYTLLWQIKKGLRDANSLPRPLAVQGRTKWLESEYHAWIERNSRHESEKPCIDPAPKARPAKIGRPRSTGPVQISLY